MDSQSQTLVNAQVVTDQPRASLEDVIHMEPLKEVYKETLDMDTGNKEKEEEMKKRREFADGADDVIDGATFCCFVMADDCDWFCISSLCRMLGHCCAGISKCTESCCEGCASCLTDCCESGDGGCCSSDDCCSGGDVGNDGCCSGGGSGGDVDVGGDDCAGCLDCCSCDSS